MRALWLAAALVLGCSPNLPDPVEPLARTPDAAFRKRAPERLPGASAARLPPVRTERLANGLLVVVATRTSSPSTSMELVVRGAGFEAQRDATGLALAVLYALSIPPDASFMADVDDGAAYLGIEADETELDAAVRSLAEAFTRPKFDENVLATARRYVSRRHEGVWFSNLIRATAYARLYAEPPALLSMPRISEYAITKEAVLRQYELHYGPENAALVVATSAPFERVLSLATEHLGGWKAGGRPTPEAPTALPFLVPSHGPRPVVAIDYDKDMAHALLILPAPPKGFSGFPEYLLADALLGGSLGSRGYEALRNHDAKSYGVQSELIRRRKGSELQISFAVEQDDLVECLQKMLGEVERLRTELVSTEELEIAKIAWRARLSSRLVTSFGTVGLLRDGFALDGDPMALGGIIESVERVSPADIQAVARREFTTERMQVVVFASRKRLEAALRNVGPIWWQELRR